MLAACDYVRDDVMTDIGVRLEDATSEGESVHSVLCTCTVLVDLTEEMSPLNLGEASSWKLDDPATLKQEVATKRLEVILSPHHRGSSSVHTLLGSHSGILCGRLRPKQSKATPRCWPRKRRSSKI